MFPKMPRVRPLVAALALTGAVIPLSACEREWCTNDSAGVTGVRLVLDFSQVDGDHEVIVHRDQRETVCTYTWPLSDTIDDVCDGGGDVQISFEGEALKVSLDEEHPDTIDVQVLRDGAELLSERFVPDYEVRGGDRCGRDFWAHETATF
jgi:hypothetical protein